MLSILQGGWGSKPGSSCLWDQNFAARATSPAPATSCPWKYPQQAKMFSWISWAVAYNRRSSFAFTSSSQGPVTRQHPAYYISHLLWPWEEHLVFKRQQKKNVKGSWNCNDATVRKKPALRLPGAFGRLWKKSSRSRRTDNKESHQKCAFVRTNVGDRTVTLFSHLLT